MPEATPQRYWWYTAMYLTQNNIGGDHPRYGAPDRCQGVSTKHPFLECADITEDNEDGSQNITYHSLVDFKEITKEEYDLFIETYGDESFITPDWGHLREALEFLFQRYRR